MRSCSESSFMTGSHRVTAGGGRPRHAGTLPPLLRCLHPQTQGALPAAGTLPSLLRCLDPQTPGALPARSNTVMGAMVSAVPTFELYKGAQKVDGFTGARVGGRRGPLLPACAACLAQPDRGLRMQQARAVMHVLWVGGMHAQGVTSMAAAVRSQKRPGRRACGRGSCTTAPLCTCLQTC